ncbi:MAG: hypothetical protein ABIN97_01425 [Ginsengibacter sp.]
MQSIDFSSDNVERLITLTDILGDTLIKAGFGVYIDQLSQIRLAAERHDKESFEKQVINRDMFGGAGALWEIWIDDKQLQNKFERQFCEFVDQLKKMGINDKRVNQIRKGFIRGDKI